VKTFTTHSCPPLRYFFSLNVTLSHRIVLGKDWVLSPYVLSPCSLPLPPTCLLVTVNEARSYFASSIRDYTLQNPRRLSIFILTAAGTWIRLCIKMIISITWLIDFDGVRLRLWTAATNGHIVHLPDDIWGWRTTMELYLQGKTEELGEKPVAVPLCPQQIPHGLTRARTRDSTVRGRRLTTWAMAQSLNISTHRVRNTFY
jgi:hypothetical protein